MKLIRKQVRQARREGKEPPVITEADVAEGFVAKKISSLNLGANPDK